jgi:hypothetical protein
VVAKMFGVSVKITSTIIGMLVVFIIFLWALFLILGSPDCDQLSNTTAYNLKFAIDEVSTDRVPFVAYGDEPDSTEYRTAAIRLCQEDYLYSKLTSPIGSPGGNIGDQIYSWVLKLFGGEPQYQIYYEIFPEGGSGMWKESYPWNGGAASTFLFWAVTRGISIGVEALSPLVIGTKAGWGIFQWLMGSGEVAETAVESSSSFISQYGQPFMLGQLMTQMGTSFLIASGSDNLSISDKNIIFFNSERRQAIDAVDLLNEKHSEAIIEGLKNSNFIRKNADGSLVRVGSRIAINNEELPMIFNKKEVSGETWKLTEYAMAVKQTVSGEFNPENVDWNDVKDYAVSKDSYGNYIPPTVDAGYILLTYKPNELVRNMYNELVKSNDEYDKERAGELKSYWYWDEDVVGTSFTPDDVLDTNYGYEIYNRGVTNFNSRISNLKKQGALTKETVLHSGDLTLMLEGFREAAFAGDADAANINEAFLSILGDTSNGVYNKICYVLNRTDSCVVSYNDMFDALQTDLKSNIKAGIYHPDVGVAGIMMLWNDSGINVDVKIMDIIMSNPLMRSNPGGVNNPFILTEVRPIDKAGLSDSDIIDIYNKQLEWLHDPSGGNYDIKNDASVIPKGMGKLYLKRWANVLKQSSPPRWAINDIGFIIGLYMQESSAVQSVIPEKYQKIITASGFNNKTEISFQGGLIWELVKRPLFWNVEQLITPTSGIAKGFLLSSTIGCLGNSLCVYSHGALMNPEKPFYLNESVKDYFIRLWRPVSPLMSVAGVEGFLKQVPSHPRFYVVSPCFGTAKVWKTMYNGKKTIFIKIDKFDLNDTASNYCYADEGLINQYGAIWFLSTVGQVVESVASWYYGGIIAKVINVADPVLLAQAAAEAYISWPGWPFKSLNFTTMNPGSSMLKNINETLK